MMNAESGIAALCLFHKIKQRYIILFQIAIKESLFRCFKGFFIRYKNCNYFLYPSEIPHPTVFYSSFIIPHSSLSQLSLHQSGRYSKTIDASPPEPPKNLSQSLHKSGLYSKRIKVVPTRRRCIVSIPS